jgi:muconolactone delta-isomerase
MRFLVIWRQMGYVPSQELKPALAAMVDYFKKLRSQGKIEAHYGFVGEIAGATVFNVASEGELDSFLLESPVAFYTTREIHPIVSHEGREEVIKRLLG